MASSRSILTLSLFLIVLQVTHSRHHKYRKVQSQASVNDFDLLVFSQSWPQIVCFLWKESVSSHTYSLPKLGEWTVHGLWPNRFHEKDSPSYCNKTEHFNETALSPIVHQLDEKWTNIHDGIPHSSLWRHEWEKHGTCASAIEDLNTELKYFQKGLDLLDEYDMTRVLAKASILPGQNYAIQRILDDVQKVLGKTVIIECVQNSKTQESYLYEIWICFNKSLELTDCNDMSDFPTNCDRTMPVNYPATTPSEYEVVLIQ